jgi:glycosyltransferase involved in cell wall biosynthesis
VYQRIVGFKHAKGDYVLQLDDDILLNNRCLERLVISLEELPEHSAVSPCLFNINGESLYESIYLRASCTKCDSFGKQTIISSGQMLPALTLSKVSQRLPPKDGITTLIIR